MMIGPEAAHTEGGSPFLNEVPVFQGVSESGGAEAGAGDPDLTGDVFHGNPEHTEDASTVATVAPVRYTGQENAGVAADPEEAIRSLDPLATVIGLDGERIVYVRAPKGGHEGRTARTAIRAGAGLAALLLTGGAAVLALRSCGAATQTQITVEEANSIITKISLVDRQQFAEAQGSDTVDISSAMRTEIAGIPFTGIKAWTPWYGSEHAGGTESGYIDAVLERADAVSLAAAKDEKGEWYVQATVDVSGLGIQGVNDFWTASGGQEDGAIMKFLSAFVNTNREDRLNDTEEMALNNLEGSGTEVLGNPDIVAAGIAGLIENNILDPSAKLLEKTGPQGVQLFKDLAGHPFYIKFVNYQTKGTDRGKAIVDTASNVLPQVTPVESSQETITVPVVVGPPSEISLGTEAQMSRGTLVSITALNQYAKILKTVSLSPAGWYIVQPQTPAQPATSSSGN